jgi:transcriptional regulator with XRE-family HTH domain
MPKRNSVVEGPHPIDVEVGARLRSARKQRGLSQQKLADALGVSFQQVQKYETGANRVSCSTLVSMAEVLGMAPASLLPETTADIVDLGISTRDPAARDAASAIASIPSNEVRRTLYQLAHVLAAQAQALNTRDDTGADAISPGGPG